LKQIDKAIIALAKLDLVNTTIYCTQGIQEDVIKYKMICKVMKND